MDLLDLWPYAAGYAVVIAVINGIVAAARPKWLGWRLVFVSAAIGPIAVLIIALAIVNAPGATGLTLVFTWFFAAVAFLASWTIGGLVSLAISSWIKHAIEQERKRPNPD